jgi:putative CocE/NonD family hydrolase
VLLQRQAYGRRIGCAICYAHPAWYAAHGYVVVVQDVRGRGTSEGDFRPGEREASDGAEAVEWAARIEGTTGEVGMFGFSYQAFNQYLAASGDCPSLKALVPAMGPWSVGRSWMFENGALRLKQAVGWGVQITAEAARRKGDAKAYAELSAVSAALPVRGPIAARPDILMRHAGLSHFADWIERRADDPYWDSVSPAAVAGRIADRKLPILMIGGWFDTHFGSTLLAHEALGGPHVKLVVGPWMHFPWIRKTGAIDFGPEADFDVDALQIRWFDRWLKGIDTGVEAMPPIRLFDMGAMEWRDAVDWPKPGRTLLLGGGGRASIRADDGKLTIRPLPASVERIVHDPWRPAPAIGGSHGTPGGPIDRSATDLRGDILTFSTAPLAAPLTIAGLISVELAAEADCPSFDISCTLSRVAVSGQSFQLAAGYALVPAGDGERQVAISLQASCATLNAGERLRLSIAGASFPAFPVNPGTGADPAATPSVDARIITLSIRCGGEGGSRLLLPIEDASALQEAEG